MGAILWSIIGLLALSNLFNRFVISQQRKVIDELNRLCGKSIEQSEYFMGKYFELKQKNDEK